MDSAFSVHLCIFNISASLKIHGKPTSEIIENPLYFLLKMSVCFQFFSSRLSSVLKKSQKTGENNNVNSTQVSCRGLPIQQTAWYLWEEIWNPCKCARVYGIHIVIPKFNFCRSFGLFDFCYKRCFNIVTNQNVCFRFCTVT